MNFVWLLLLANSIIQVFSQNNSSFSTIASLEPGINCTTANSTTCPQVTTSSSNSTTIHSYTDTTTVLCNFVTVTECNSDGPTTTVSSTASTVRCTVQVSTVCASSTTDLTTSSNTSFSPSQTTPTDNTTPVQCATETVTSCDYPTTTSTTAETSDDDKTPDDDDGDEVNFGLIIGCVVGGVVIIGASIAGVYIYRKRKLNKSHDKKKLKKDKIIGYDNDAYGINMKESKPIQSSGDITGVLPQEYVSGYKASLSNVDPSKKYSIKRL